MIKLEEENFSTDRLCLNPNCTLSFERVFSSQHEHNFLKNCQNWIVEFASIQRMSPEPSPKFEINLGRRPLIDSLKNIAELSVTNWEGYFQKKQGEVIGSLVTQIGSLFNKIKEQIRQIKAEALFKSLVKLSIMPDFNLLQNEIQSMIQLYIRPLSEKIIHLNFLEKSILSIPESVMDNFTKKYYMQQKNQSQHLLIDLEDNQKFENFIFEFDFNGAFNKVQQISSICEIQQVQFEVLKDKISLRCPFCLETFHVQKEQDKKNKERPKQKLKIIKKQISVKILKHLWQYHYEDIYHHYNFKILSPQKKFEKSLITYNQALSDIKEHSKLFIIDRQSGVKFQVPKKNKTNKNSEDTLFIEILSLGNQKMAKMKHILTPDRATTESLIYYLVSDICESKKLISISDVTIISNSCRIEKVLNLIKVLKGNKEDINLQGSAKPQALSKKTNERKINPKINKKFNKNKQQILDRQSVKLQMPMKIQTPIKQQQIHEQLKNKDCHKSKIKLKQQFEY